jgi:hypothetical protein
MDVTYERGASAEGDFFEAFSAIEIFDADLDLALRETAN